MAAQSAASWKSLFQKHIGLLGNATPRFTLATVSIKPPSSPPATATTTSATSASAMKALSIHASVTPRSRILLFRGFYGELSPTPYNKAPLNPEGLSSDLLTYTTDTRMHKVSQLGGEGCADNAVEAVFWIPKQGTDNPNIGWQWRIRGRSVVLPKTADEESKSFIKERLRGDKKEAFDVDKETTAHFGNVSPVIQKSFKQPMPGTPKEKGNSNPEWGLGMKVDGLHDKVARENFRVAVIEPRRVEVVDLTGQAAEKWVWVKAGSEEEIEEELQEYGRVEGEWRKVELYP